MFSIALASLIFFCFRIGGWLKAALQEQYIGTKFHQFFILKKHFYK